MKKALKIIISILVVGAGVAGGLFVYNKIKAKKAAELADDFDEDFDDGFDEEDDVAEREYVDINTSAQTADAEAEEQTETQAEETEE